MRNVSFSLKLHTRLNVVTDLVTMIKWQKLNSWHFRQVNVTSESLRTQRTPKYRRSNCHGSGFALSITYQPVQISSSDKSPESDQNVRDGRDGIRFSVVPNELLPSVPSISSPILVSKWSRGFTATVDSSLQFWKKIQLSFHIQVKAPWGFIFFVLGGKCPMMRLGGGGVNFLHLLKSGFSNSKSWKVPTAGANLTIYGVKTGLEWSGVGWFRKQGTRKRGNKRLEKKKVWGVGKTERRKQKRWAIESGWHVLGVNHLWPLP